MKHFYLVTGNMGKVHEAELVLGERVEYINIDLDEIQEMDTNKIAEHKVKQAWEQVKQPLLIWDQSLFIHCLNGFPGPLVKWFWQTVTLEKICQIAQLMEDSAISTKASLTYYDGKIIKHFTGESNGHIPDHPKGKGGFGWDPIFIPEGSQLTYSEMDETDPLYHVFNKQAWTKIKDFLE